MRQKQRRDGIVVIEQIALAVPVLGIEQFVEIGELQTSAVDGERGFFEIFA